MSRPRLIFLHFARKTFNPWAGLKTDSRSAAGRWPARSVPDWPPGRRHRWPSAKTGGRGILSRGLRRAAQTVLPRICTFNKSECEYRAAPRKRETVKSVAPPERRVAAIYFSA